MPIKKIHPRTATLRTGPLAVIPDQHRQDVTTETMARITLAKIRSDILEGVLAPGASLRIALLQKDYEVGNTPLREALFHLASEGLVELNSRRGFRVASMSAQELIEVTHVRKWIERLALKESLENGDAHWEARVLSAFHIMSRVEQTDKNWDHLNREFHEAIVSNCSLGVLHKFRTHLYDVTTRYRKLAWRYAKKPDAELDLAEHREILNAALSRNYNRSAELLDEHLDGLVRVILRTFAQNDVGGVKSAHPA